MSKSITKEEILKLMELPTEELCEMADQIRKDNCGDSFDLCSIINAKSGKCSEDCKYCAQSAHYCTSADEYPLLDEKTIVEGARVNSEAGVMRYSLVTSGKRLPMDDVDKVCDIVKTIKKEVGIDVCASLGLLGEEAFAKLKEAGISRIHCNLEASRNYFPNICTTHTYDEKIETIKAARKAGLDVCSGGIMGLGESMEDRIDLAMELRDLEIMSIPVNFLNPIPGTPLEGNKPLTEDEKLRTIAMFRIVNPKAYVRLAGGRGIMPDKGFGFFTSGANAAITGDMLTTAGITVKTDRKVLIDLGFNLK